MNILFITLEPVSSLSEKGIYSDLLREFRKNGHKVYVITPCFGVKNSKAAEESAEIAKVNVGSIFNTNIIKKGINTLLIEYRYKKAIKAFYSDIHFDLVLYPTPPVTIVGAVEYVKKRDHARTYLLLKDIFPQNAVDIGMMKKTGVKGILYHLFRSKEKKLYAVSDHIGCMSQANAEYILRHNPEINAPNVEVCPNSIELQDLRVDDNTKTAMRQKYGIPLDKKVFVYGGNLGKPQGIPFLIRCLEAAQQCEEAYFLIVGDGTEYGKLEHFFKTACPKNAKLMQRLPKEDYDRMVAACDVGMIFLDHRFTIPNFPSRLLSYMQAGLPVLNCTDPNTDIGTVAENGGFGWRCESDDVSAFLACVENACHSDLESMGDCAMEYLKKEYSVADSYQKIVGSMK